MQTDIRDEPGVDGTERKTHYGSGRQPWDEIVDAGWGPQFAAGNVLKYLRRTKTPEHSLESARWYWRQIVDHVIGVGDHRGHEEWAAVKIRLVLRLTVAELALLEKRA